LVAVCAIPFALAQRNRLTSTKARATKPAPTKAQIAAAQGKVFQSGAPGALAGRQAAPKAASQSKAGSPMLPFDVRSNPAADLVANLFGHNTGARKNVSVKGNNPLLTYVIDDGTAEDLIGLTAGGTFVALNSFPVSGGNNVITSISIAWGTPNFPDPSLDGLSYTAV